MNIELSTKFSFCYSAMLTCVVVSFARLGSLAVPVWAIIREVSTLPERIVFACFILGAPKPIALMITKVPVLIECSGNNGKLFTALPAFGWNAFVVRAILACGVFRLPLAPTGSTAKVVLPSCGKGSFTGKRLSALSALNICTTVTITILARIVLFVPRAGTRAAAIISLVFFGGACFARKRLSAFRANQICPSNRLGFALARLASRCKAVLFRFVALEVLSCSGKMLLTEVALLKLRAWGIMGLHVESPFDLPRPRVFTHRWDNCFPPVIIPQCGVKSYASS